VITYVTGRIARAVPVLLLASIAVFMVLRLVPGDPAEALAGEDASQQRIDEVRVQLGLNDS
jgi:peptide/nickel transport system permease protein